MPSKFIKLSKPVQVHGQLLDELELKEPSGADYLRLGDPRILVFNASGSGYWVEQADAISGYLEKCLAHEMGAMIITLLSLDDVMGLKEGLFGFFTDAANRRSAISSIPSSSASA